MCLRGVLAHPLFRPAIWRHLYADRQCRRKYGKLLGEYVARLEQGKARRTYTVGQANRAARRYPWLRHVFGKSFLMLQVLKHRGQTVPDTPSPFASMVLSDEGKDRWFGVSAEEATDALRAAYRLGATYPGQIELIRSGKAEGQERLLWELVLALPLASVGLRYKFEQESREQGRRTPDWSSEIGGVAVAFEACTKAMPSEGVSEHRRKSDEFHSYVKKATKRGKRGAFFMERVMQPFGPVGRVEKIEKIRRMKSSRQARHFPVRVLVLNFDSIRAISIDECLPEFDEGNGQLRFTGIVHAAFFGRKDEVVHMGGSFDRGRVTSNGRFVQGSGYHFALVRAEKQYALLCNPQRQDENRVAAVKQALGKAYRPIHVLTE